jgi:hypothetical protein
VGIEAGEFVPGVMGEGVQEALGGAGEVAVVTGDAEEDGVVVFQVVGSCLSDLIDVGIVVL